jgi:phospholipid-binding lipoprotein MlaA
VRAAPTQRLLLLLLLACMLFGCASGSGPGRLERNPDPWEKVNRGLFAFNDRVDGWVLEPVAKAWNFVLPRPVKLGIQNFSDNLWMPAVFGNHLLQAHPKQAFLEDLPRLLLNTTIGVGGLFDFASTQGYEKSYTDFGITMGRWGVPPGPYVVIPFLGPSSVRNVGGRVVDTFSTPYTYFVPWYGFAVFRTIELMNRRALYFEELAHARTDSFDYYVFMRDAWSQNRRHYVRAARGESTLESFDDDLYDLDEFDDEIFEEQEAAAEAQSGGPEP